jgi:CubicO group peptidase (beta-lactamase class C family)
MEERQKQKKISLLRRSQFVFPLILLLSLSFFTSSGSLYASFNQDDGPRDHLFQEVRNRLSLAIKKLPEKIKERMRQHRLASLSLAVVHDGEIIFSQAFGYADIEKKIAATPETIYPIASVTKVFTATMLMQLCEKGLVSLDTPLKKYLPEYKLKSKFPGTRPTTLLQLASHTSGLPEDAPQNFWVNYSGFIWLVTNGESGMEWFVSIKNIISNLNLIELEYPPDIYSHYSNLGMQLLGIALERAAGQPFTDHVASQILKPLGMNNSGFFLDQEIRSRLAVGHVCTDRQSPFLATPLWEPGCALYSGGLYSTADDMARFISLQFQEGQLGGTQILSPASLRRMRSPNSIRRPGEYDSYGIGWAVVRIAGFDAIEHNGALLGHRAHASAIPEFKLGIVILSNSRNYSFSPDACKNLAREIYRDLLSNIKDADREVSFDPNAVNLEQYKGTYTLPGGIAKMEVTAGNGKLFMSIKQDPEFNEPFTPTALHEFSFEADPGRKPMLFFHSDSSGRIVKATFLSYTFNRIKDEI